MGADAREEFSRGLPKTVESAATAIPAALDFVLGRRATRKADLHWLGAVCVALPPAAKALSRVRDLLRPCSEFARLWEGELLPRDVKEIVSAITVALSTNSVDT